MEPRVGKVFDATNLRKEWMLACAASALGRIIKVTGKEYDPRYEGLTSHAAVGCSESGAGWECGISGYENLGSPNSQSVRQVRRRVRGRLDEGNGEGRFEPLWWNFSETAASEAVQVIDGAIV
jgi:hypothetical protein